MSIFETYLRLGLLHITDLHAYDHLLFILAICAGFEPADWRRVAWLVTAFTAGHSVTLTLATSGLIVVSSRLVEILIPVTILATCVMNLARLGGRGGRHREASYALAGAFGLIHGLGFSSYLRAVLGREASILQPLLAFNVGLEIGQLTIVAAALLLALIADTALGFDRRRWTVLVSGVAGVISVRLIVLAGLS